MGSAHPEAVIVLAAGEGRRMRSHLPKVLHAIGGRSLIEHALAAARACSPEYVVTVVRHERDALVDHVLAIDADVLIADQDDIAGTGRAVACGLTALPETLAGTLLVTYGDVPLLTGQTLTELLATHADEGAAVTVLTARVADPTGYGRIVRDSEGRVAAIIEHRDATAGQLEITEINSGVYAFDLGFLRWALTRIGQDNAQGEVYLTDVIEIARGAGRPVSAHTTADLWQVEGVNDRVQLAALGAELNRRTVEGWMRAGVTVVDPATTWIDVDVRLAQDVLIRPGTQLLDGTVIETGAEIGPDTTLSGCTVGARASIVRTHGSGAVIGAEAAVGPFTYLRPGTRLGVGGKIGGFVETKNATIGAGSKVPHLSYVGDAEIGEHTNIGAATIFVNYDGVAKHHSLVGSHVRIGSDTMLVAPVTIGDGAYTAAGSVITKDVPAGALAVERAPQRNVEGWVARARPGSPAARAAAAAEMRRAATSDHEPDPNPAAKARPTP